MKDLVFVGVLYCVLKPKDPRRNTLTSMKIKLSNALRIAAASVVVAGTFCALTSNAEDTTYNAEFYTYYPDQAEFPLVLLQPINQVVHVHEEASFSVYATNGPLTYQWLKNNVALLGETNSILTIAGAKKSDVGLYSCNVSKGLEIVPTRSASLMVFVNSTDPDTGIDPVTLWATPVPSSGSSGSCPGPYKGYINYTRTVAQGWGWAPSTNTTVHTAEDTNSVNTKVQFVGRSGDSGCNQTIATVPDPSISTKYRFTIYFTNSVPTNSYSITLDGFDP